jgi:CHASE3 domain sensor protein
VPALVMVGGFVAAILWAAASLHHVDAAGAAALAGAAISADTATLVDAVRGAEISQRDYLLTGGTPRRDAFEADLRHVDQLLVSPASLAAGEWPGYGAATRLQGVVEGRLRTLAAEAHASHAPAVGAAGAVVSAEAGQETAAWLRQWATGLVERSRQAISGSLASIRANLSLVLLVLAGGVVHGLWSAVAAVLRRWRGAGAIAGGLPGRADLARGTPPALTYRRYF